MRHNCANVGGADRVLRFLIGAGLVAAPYLFPEWAIWHEIIWRSLIQIVGALLFVSALMRFCWAYHLLGMSTCRAKGGGSCCAKRKSEGEKSCCGGNHHNHDHHHHDEGQTDKAEKS